MHERRDLALFLFMLDLKIKNMNYILRGRVTNISRAVQQSWFEHAGNNLVQAIDKRCINSNDQNMPRNLFFAGLEPVP